MVSLVLFSRDTEEVEGGCTWCLRKKRTSLRSIGIGDSRTIRCRSEPVSASALSVLKGDSNVHGSNHLGGWFDPHEDLVLRKMIERADLVVKQLGVVEQRVQPAPQLEGRRFVSPKWFYGGVQCASCMFKYS